MKTYFSVRRSANECDGDEWEDIEAYDAQEAAEEYVNSNYSNWEYPQGPIEVEVRDVEGVQTFSVAVEAVPTFHAEVLDYESHNECIHVRKPDTATPEGYCWMCKQTFPHLVGVGKDNKRLW